MLQKESPTAACENLVFAGKEQVLGGAVTVVERHS